MGIINRWKKTRKSNAEAELMLSDIKVRALLKKIDNKGYTPTDKEIAALSKVESIYLNSIPKSIYMLTSLKHLYLWFCEDTIGLSNIENLTNLQCLDLSFSKNISLRGIEKLTNLQELWLLESQITDLSVIENLTNLQWLVLSETKITSLSVIENLTNLEELYLDKTKITSLSGIENLTNLQGLDLSRTQITNLSGIENLTNLQRLDLSETPITNLSGIENLTNLQWLWLRDTQIDSHELKRLSKLKNLTFLDLRHLKLTGIPSQLLELKLPFDTTNKDPSCLERGIFLHGTVLTEQPLRLFKKDRSLIEEYYKSEIASSGEAEKTNNS